MHFAIYGTITLKTSVPMVVKLVRLSVTETDTESG